MATPEFGAFLRWKLRDFLDVPSSMPRFASRWRLELLSNAEVLHGSEMLTIEKVLQ